MNEYFAEATIDLIEASELCVSEGRQSAALALVFRAKELPRVGLMETRDHLGSLARHAQDAEARAAYEMAYASIQRIILRVIAQRGLGALT